MLSRLLYQLYAIRRRKLRQLIRKIVKKLEGGEMLSPTLRRIFLDYHGIEIGLHSYGGCFNSAHIGTRTKIGRYCSFAAGVWRLNGNHPTTFRSMHPYFYHPGFGYVRKELIFRSEIVIGNDVWIGQNAIILPTVRRIGDGAVIGAGAIVTKDVPDFAIVLGNPAKVVKYRFSGETIDKIKRQAWWNKDIEELKSDFEKFMQPIEEDLNEVQKN
jgi:virginiamycin A acetyltransferase